MPRVREFNELRPVSSRKLNQPAKSVDNKLCVNCINHKLHESRQKKEQDHRHRHEANLSSLSLSSRQLRRPELKREVDEFNQKKAQLDKARREDPSKKLHSQLIKNAQEIYDRTVEEQKLAQEERRQHLKLELESQIKEHKSKKEKQNWEVKSRPVSSIIPDRQHPNYNQEYRKAIIEQINSQKALKRMKTVNNEVGGALLPMTQQAAQRENQHRQEAYKKKHEIADEIRQQQTEVARRKEEEKRKKQQEIARRDQNQRKIENEKEITQLQRQKEIDGYLAQLKDQIEFNKVKRAEERHRLQNNQMAYILPTPQPAQSSECGGCHKHYQKNQLAHYPPEEVILKERRQGV